MVIEIPPLLGAHREAWVAVLEIATRLPEDWTLVGGQMVLLHCWERDRSPAVARRGKARTSLLGVVGYLQANRPLWVGVDGADQGLDRLRVALSG